MILYHLNVKEIKIINIYHIFRLEYILLYTIMVTKYNYLYVLLRKGLTKAKISRAHKSHHITLFMVRKSFGVGEDI